MAATTQMALLVLLSSQADLMAALRAESLITIPQVVVAAVRVVLVRLERTQVVLSVVLVVLGVTSQRGVANPLELLTTEAVAVVGRVVARELLVREVLVVAVQEVVVAMLAATAVRTRAVVAVAQARSP